MDRQLAVVIPRYAQHRALKRRSISAITVLCECWFMHFVGEFADKHVYSVMVEEESGPN